MSGHCVWTEKHFTNVFYFPCHGQWWPNPIKIDSLHVAFNVHNIHIKSVDSFVNLQFSVAFDISIVLIQLRQFCEFTVFCLWQLIELFDLRWEETYYLIALIKQDFVVSVSSFWWCCIRKKQNKIFFFDKSGKDQNMKSVLANNHKWVQLYTYTVSLMTLIDEMHLNILWQLVRIWRQGCPSWLTSFWLFPQSPWVQKAWH